MQFTRIGNLIEYRLMPMICGGYDAHMARRSYDVYERATIASMSAQRKTSAPAARLWAGVERQAVDGPAGDRKLYIAVVRNLAAQIIRAEPGQILAFPSETELCRSLGVSRTVLREAVKVLETKGLIEVSHGRGMLSRPQRHWNHLDPDILKWQCEAGADGLFFRNLWEFREIIEPAAAALAAERVNEAEIRTLTGLCRKMEKGVRKSEVYLKADSELHDTIFEASRNPVLQRTTQSLREAFQAARRVSIRVSGWPYSLPLHRTLVDAIARHDPAGARAASLLIIRNAAHDIKAVLASRVKAPSTNSAQVD